MSGNSRDKKIIEEIEKDLKDPYKNSLGLNDTIRGLSQGLATLINDHQIKMFGVEDFDLEMIIRKIVKNHSMINGLVIINIAALFTRYFLWKEHLPKVTPFYAVKSCDDDVIIKTLKELGVNFDIASRGELTLLKELDVPGERMIFANPVKHHTYISHAKTEGVEYFTFDSIFELKKISIVYPRAKLILRICVDDSGSVIKFSAKFGCPAKNYDKVFALAKELKLNVVGVSFHVGSSCQDNTAHKKAIEEARKVFSLATDYGYTLDVLDIGGGFPGKEKQNDHFIKMAQGINAALTEHFDDIPNLKIWAEPGRFFSTSAATLVFSIIGKNEFQTEEGEMKINYTGNTSVYSVASNVIFDHEEIDIKVLSDVHEKEQFESIVFGHSCDGIDILATMKLPELDYEDICFVENMGAYTLASASNFNGFEDPERIYIYNY